MRNLKKRNGLVVEFNPLLSCLFKCNTNVSLLGSFSQAKSLLLYLLKYVTKAPADVTASITILKDARIRMDQFPSQAEDADTIERDALRYLQVISNMMVGASEYSACTAAYAILNYLAEIYSTPFWYVFINHAISYSKKTLNRNKYKKNKITIQLPRKNYEKKEKKKIIFQINFKILKYLRNYRLI